MYSLTVLKAGSLQLRCGYSRPLPRGSKGEFFPSPFQLLEAPAWLGGKGASGSIFQTHFSSLWFCVHHLSKTSPPALLPPCPRTPGMTSRSHGEIPGVCPYLKTLNHTSHPATPL